MSKHSSTWCTHYYTAPGLAFDATLKITKVEFKLLTDLDHIMLIKKGVRGGVSQCWNRYGIVSHKYMGSDFDLSSP